MESPAQAFLDPQILVENLETDVDELLVALVKAKNLFYFVLESMVTLAHLSADLDPEAAVCMIVKLSIIAYDMRPEIRNKTLSKSLQYGLTMVIKRRYKI